MSRTIVFIDGFNLYYSRFCGTPFKWLDVVALFRDESLRVQDPKSVVIGVQYFTAPIKASYATHGVVSEQAQTQYHRALVARHAGLMQVVQGFHTFEVATLPAHTPGTPANKSTRSAVWMIEEKQADVEPAIRWCRRNNHTRFKTRCPATCYPLPTCMAPSKVPPHSRS